MNRGTEQSKIQQSLKRVGISLALLVVITMIRTPLEMWLGSNPWVMAFLGAYVFFAFNVRDVMWHAISGRLSKDFLLHIVFAVSLGLLAASATWSSSDPRIANDKWLLILGVPAFLIAVGWLADRLFFSHGKPDSRQNTGKDRHDR